MLNNKKVIEALHTIQNICINTDCDIDCPFADNTGICLLSVNEPRYWVINDRVPIWRAFEL